MILALFTVVIAYQLPIPADLPAGSQIPSLALPGGGAATQADWEKETVTNYENVNHEGKVVEESLRKLQEDVTTEKNEHSSFIQVDVNAAGEIKKKDVNILDGSMIPSVPLPGGVAATQADWAKETETNYENIDHEGKVVEESLRKLQEDVTSEKNEHSSFIQTESKVKKGKKLFESFSHDFFTPVHTDYSFIDASKITADVSQACHEASMQWSDKLQKVEPNKEAYDACAMVLSPRGENEGGDDSCVKVNVKGGTILTGKLSAALSVLSPYYDLHQKYFDAEEQHRMLTYYEAKPSAHGCGLSARRNIKAGTKIGLCGVEEATNYRGIMIGFQDTPWLGGLPNHCDRGNMEVRKTAGDQMNGEPDRLYLYALHDIEKGQDMTCDYNIVHQNFPEAVQGADPSWTCPADNLRHE